MYRLLICAFVVFGAREAFSVESLNRAVTFKSSPPAAFVCKKILKREECLGKTPLSINLELATATTSKRFLVKKLGYRSEQILVDANSVTIMVNLKKRDLFYAPDLHKDLKLKQVQKLVNAKISDVIYSNKRDGIPGYQLTGQLKVFRSKSGILLGFPLIINSAKELKRLKKAGRIRNTQRRHQSTINELNATGVFELFGDISKTLSAIPLDAIVFNVFYSKSKAVLDVNQVQQVSQYYSHSYTTGYGDVVQKVDVYKSYTYTRDNTVVKDTVKTVDYRFVVDKNVLALTLKTPFYELLTKLNIATNDGRKNRYEEVVFGEQ